MPLPLSNSKRYLVVGASGTIGSAVVRRLVGRNVLVGLHYCQNRTAVEELEELIKSAGGQGVLLQSALDSEESCAQLSRQAHAELGSPDGIVFCGGRVPWRAWQEISQADWEKALFEHCIAPFTLARHAVPEMQRRGHGRIVYLSSIAPKYGGSARTLHYAAAKAALETAMRGLARDVARSGVGINGVRAGFVHSPQQNAGRTPQEIADRIEMIPMRRPGTPEEVAAAITFLLSPEAAFITNEILAVSGGD